MSECGIEIPPGMKFPITIGKYISSEKTIVWFPVELKQEGNTITWTQNVWVGRIVP